MNIFAIFVLPSDSNCVDTVNGTGLGDQCQQATRKRDDQEKGSIIKILTTPYIAERNYAGTSLKGTKRIINETSTATTVLVSPLCPQATDNELVALAREFVFYSEDTLVQI